MYMQQQHEGGPGPGPGSMSSPHQPNSHIHNQNQNQYSFAFDPSYPQAPGAGPSTSTNPNPNPTPSPSPMNQGPSTSTSYEYSYSRGQHEMGQQGMGMDAGAGAGGGFQNGMDDQAWPTTNGNGGGMYGGGGAGAGPSSGPTSQERSTSQHQHQPQHQQQSQQSVWPPQPYDLGSSSSSPYLYGAGVAEPWGQRAKVISNTQWPDEYVEPSGPERELGSLQMTLSDLVESIRPHASSSSNPRPTRPPPYLQARFLRLASTVQTSLSNLQPHLHQTLHPQFTRQPPRNRTYPNNGTESGEGSGPGDSSGNGSGKVNGNGTGGEMTAAEKEMEVIRKRRDMLIARAAQVQASSHPSAVHQSQLPANWNHGEVYQNGGGIYNTNTNTNTNTGTPPAANINPSSNPNLNGLNLFASNPLFANPNDNLNLNHSPSLNSSRRSTITLDNFDTSLARFSLDPTKIGQIQNGHIGTVPNGNGNGNGVGNGNGDAKQKAGGPGTGAGITPDGGRCHGCGASVTPEWRMGPDGPRSLCNACGLHYAKITKRRAQEDSNLNSNLQANGFPPTVVTPVGF